VTPSSFRFVPKVIPTLLLVVAVLVAAPAGTGFAMGTDVYGAPSISSDQADYAPGSSVTLTGANWQPGEVVHIVVNDDQGQSWSHTADVTADATGMLQDQFTLPSWFVASYSVTATGPVTGTAVATFTDASISIAPTSGAPGSTVTVTGQGFNNSTVTVEFDGSQVSTSPSVCTASSGNPQFSCTLVVPTNASPGAHTVTAVVGSKSASAQFSVSGPASTNLTVSPSSGTYGATTNLTATLTSGGSPVSGKTVSFKLNGASVASAPTNVSGIATLQNVSLAGIGTGNYAGGVQASFAGDSNFAASTSTAGLTITKAVLQVTAGNATKTYGTADPVLTWTYSGFVNGDTAAATTVTGAATCTLANGTGPGAGTYTGAITCAAGTLSAANYTFAAGNAGTLTITKAPLTVTVDDQTKTYGDTNPNLTAKYSGFVNGDTPTDLGGTLTFATTAAAVTGVGTYPITASGLTSPNYQIGYTDGTLTITRAPLVVKADDQTKTYGDANPVLTGTVTGVKNGDAIGGSYSTGADKTSSVAGGPYVIVASATGSAADLANYAVTTTNGKLAVTPAALVVKADDQTKTYGDANPVLTGTVTGVKNGDAIGGSYSTGADKTSSVAGGPYVIVAQLNATAAVLANYQSPAVTNGILTITKAPLAAKANDATRLLNAPNPAFTGTLTGVKNGDAITLGFATSATSISPVGSYSIVPQVNGTAAVLANYQTPQVTTATLTITYSYATSCDGDANRTVLQPVNSDGTSVFKKGSTVPVKFRVCDATGVSIGASGVVTGTPAAPVLLTKTNGTGGVDESVYSTASDTSFRWDPTAQQWIYNQNTNNLTSGVNYTYKIPLNDGTWITYKFGLK
jgi:hypothetical protein